MGATSFGYDPVAGAAALASFALADQSTPYVAMGGAKLQMGLMALLLDAELTAADAGLVPWVQLDDGSKGVFTVGAARDAIDTAPPGVKTLYLATHGVVRRAHNEVRPLSPGMGAVQMITSHTEDGIGDIGLIPVVALVVLGVAAIVAGAYYATSATEKLIETRSTELKYAAKLEAMHKLAGPLIAAGQPLPPGFLEEFGDFSEKEKARDAFPYLWAGGAALAAGGIYWVWTRGGLRSVRA